MQKTSDGSDVVCANYFQLCNCFSFACTFGTFLWGFPRLACLYILCAFFMLTCQVQGFKSVFYYFSFLELCVNIYPQVESKIFHVLLVSNNLLSNPTQRYFIIKSTVIVSDNRFTNL